MFSVSGSFGIKEKRNGMEELLSLKAASSNTESITFLVTEYHKSKAGKKKTKTNKQITDSFSMP